MLPYSIQSPITSRDPATTNPPNSMEAYLIGGGIASLAAAVYLTRDGHMPGRNIHILTEQSFSGSLDAIGTAEQGYSMRGSRMYGAALSIPARQCQSHRDFR